jgi:hypothetical protein
MSTTASTKCHLLTNLNAHIVHIQFSFLYSFTDRHHSSCTIKWYPVTGDVIHTQRTSTCLDGHLVTLMNMCTDLWVITMWETCTSSFANTSGLLSLTAVQQISHETPLQILFFHASQWSPCQHVASQCAATHGLFLSIGITQLCLTQHWRTQEFFRGGEGFNKFN